MSYNPPVIEEMPVRRVSKVISIKENPVSAAPAETSCESAAEIVGMGSQRWLGSLPACLPACRCSQPHPAPLRPFRSRPPASPLFTGRMGEPVTWETGTLLPVLCRDANHCSCAIHSLYRKRKRKKKKAQIQL